MKEIVDKNYIIFTRFNISKRKMSNNKKTTLNNIFLHFKSLKNYYLSYDCQNKTKNLRWPSKKVIKKPNQAMYHDLFLQICEESFASEIPYLTHAPPLLGLQPATFGRFISSNGILANKIFSLNKFRLLLNKKLGIR